MSERGLTRRQLLAAAVGLTATAHAASAAAPTPPTGWVRPPESAPAMALTDATGQPRLLGAWLRQRVTAVQTIFTGCSATCPTQGLLFSTLAQRGQVAGVRWLSLSIDPLGDDAAALAAWQRRIGGHRDWQAAVPGVNDSDALLAYLRGVPAKAASHTTQVFVFDRAGRLVYRTGDNPPIHFVEALVARVAGSGDA